MSQTTTIKETIRLATTRAGFSISKLAERAGVHRAHLSDYLSGKRDIRGETLQKVCDVLGLELVKKKG